MKNYRPVLLAVAIFGIAAGPAFGRVYKCIDPTTKAITVTDTECRLTAASTPVQSAANAEAARKALIDADVKQAAARADGQMLDRFPDEAAHQKAKVTDLEAVVVHIRRATKRLADLMAERKPLDEQAEFYKGKPLPPALQRAIDASDASFAALTALFRGLQTQVSDIVSKYDLERDRLRKLWAGAPRGSMGLLVPASASSPAR